MKETTQRQSMLSSLIVMGSTLGTRILGFVRIALISAIFGGGNQVDALNWVFSVPNNFRKLLAEGALSSAFIPELSRQIVEDPKGDRAAKLAASLLGFLLCVILPLTLFFSLFPEFIVDLLSKFPQGEKFNLAVKLMPWTIQYLLLVSISALFMGILNSHNRFFIPAITPFLFSVAVISSVLLFHRQLGVFSMILGVLIGGVLQILFQLPLIIRHGYSPLPSFRFRGEAFQRVIRRWLPMLASSSVFAVNQLVASYFATRLGDGSMTAMSNALVYWQLPFGIFFNGIVTVTYPKLSRQWTRKETREMGKTVSFGYLSLVTLLLPSALLLMTMGAEVIAITLQRGAFKLEHTILASKALWAYATGLLSVGLYNYTQRVFHAMGDVKRPLWAAMVILISDISLTVLFIFRFNMGVAGLAYANSIAFSLGFILLYMQLRQRIPLGKGDHRGAWKTLWGLLASMALGGAWIWGVRQILGYTWWHEGSNLGNWARVALEGFGFLGLLLLGFRLFHMPILSILKDRGRNRVEKTD